MRNRSIERATDRWVDAGLLDEDTASDIRDFEAEREPDRFEERRFAWLVAVMGAILVGAGILTFLAAQWDDLGTATRTAILLAAPTLAAAAGVSLDRRHLPRAGLALWIVAALLVGPSLFMLSNIHAPELAEHWLFLAWGVLALPMGHLFVTRLGTGIGIAALLLAALVAGPGETGPFVAASLGVVAIAGAIPLRGSVPALIDSYRALGLAPVIATLLWLNTREGRLAALDVELDGYLLVGLVLGFASLGLVLHWWRANRANAGDLIAVALPVAGTLCALSLVASAGAVPDFVTYLLGQAVLLGVLIGFVAVGIVEASGVLINLAMLGFLLQVGTLLVTLADQLPGTIALIVVGLVLLVVAIALERGRRELLGRVTDA